MVIKLLLVFLFLFEERLNSFYFKNKKLKIYFCTRHEIDWEENGTVSYIYSKLLPKNRL